MKRKLAWGVLGFALVAGVIWGEGDKAGGSGKVPTAQIAQGKYLVNDVAGCSDCHTPYTDKGLLDESKYLQGAPLIFKPTVQMSWAEAAPPIAGLPLLSEKDAVVFVMTGKLPGGAIPRPPMPQFKLKKTDAEAVVAYLKSLN